MAAMSSALAATPVAYSAEALASGRAAPAVWLRCFTAGFCECAPGGGPLEVVAGGDQEVEGEFTADDEHLSNAATAPSIAGIGDSYAEDLAESNIGHHQTEYVHRDGAFLSVDETKLASAYRNRDDEDPNTHVNRDARPNESLCLWRWSQQVTPASYFGPPSRDSSIRV